MSIVIQSISKVFDLKGKNETPILKNISLSISEGELVAIQGKSGAGKSTLLHIIGCLDEKTSGEYYLDNVDVSKITNSKKARLRNLKFGFVMQDYALINDESVLANLILPAIFANCSHDEAEKRADELLKKFDLFDLAKRKVSLLSGGEKQRVAIIRALMNDPPYILADEPTGALDSKNAKEIMNIFIELHKKGKAIIIVTHDNSISEMCDRVINIVDGIIFS